MRRRDFIGNTIIGTCGASLGAVGLLTKSCRGANDKVVLGLIGSGGRGLANGLNCCDMNSNVEIKSVCDVDVLRSEKAVKEINKKLGYLPEATRNMKEILDDPDIDAVYISTPDHWHALATILACQAGKDVYLEKTPTACVWEGKKMIEAEKRYKRVVQVGLQNRSGNYNNEARDYILGGKLGQIMHINIFNLMGGKKWQPLPDEKIPDTLDWDAWLGPAPYRPYNPGAHKGWHYFRDFSPGLMNDASHQLDLTRMVLGDPLHPESIYCWGGNHVYNSENEVPEIQNITYDYKEFAINCLSGNAAKYMSKTPNDIRMDQNRFPLWNTNATRIEIYGTGGVMYLGRQGGGWQVFGPGGEILAQSGGIHSELDHHVNFIECIKNRKRPNSTLEQAHLSASLVHFANIAYHTGNKQLLLDPDNEQFIDNDEANKLLKKHYRNNYAIPEKV